MVDSTHNANLSYGVGRTIGDQRESSQSGLAQAFSLTTVFHGMFSRVSQVLLIWCSLSFYPRKYSTRMIQDYLF
jgi:hypothetical protein